MHPLRSVDVFELSFVATLQAFSKDLAVETYSQRSRQDKRGRYMTRVPERHCF